MTDRQRVYTKVLRSLKETLKGQKQGHVVTLAMMITGIVMSKKAQLSVITRRSLKFSTSRFCQAGGKIFQNVLPSS